MNDFDKKFEDKMKSDWLKFPDTSIDRLYDHMDKQRYGIRNICDFIAYHYPNIFYIDCKTHKGDRFPLTFSQYDDMVKKVGIKGVRSGLVLWFYEHDLIVYLPLRTCREFRESGRKSITIKQLVDGENCIFIPSEKLRVFFNSDYSVLFNLDETW